MMEKCESRVANLLASLENLPAWDIGGKLRALAEILTVQKDEIEALQKRLAEVPKITVEYGQDRHCPVAEFHMGFSGEDGQNVWFRAVLQNGRRIDTYPLKGEV